MTEFVRCSIMSSVSVTFHFISFHEGSFSGTQHALSDVGRFMWGSIWMPILLNWRLERWQPVLSQRPTQVSPTSVLFPTLSVFEGTGSE